jgi:uncharacterized RDD family membrane protein YckC
MKCKRCLAPIPNHIDVCPNCGQDLASLRQLLKNFYEEDKLFDEQKFVPIKDKEPSIGPKEDAPVPEEPRVILKTDPDEYAQRFLAEESVADEDLLEEEEISSMGEEVYPAGFWVRLLALTIDLVFLLLLVGIFLVVGFLTMEMSIAEVRNLAFAQKMKLILPVLFPWGILLSLAYFTFSLGTWGQTLGKMIFGLRVIEKYGDPLSYTRSFLRTIAYTISLAPIFMGFLWVAFAPSKRGWHDALAGTIVIKE